MTFQLNTLTTGRSCAATNLKMCFPVCSDQKTIVNYSMAEPAITKQEPGIAKLNLQEIVDLSIRKALNP
jgi:lauroyl/myristoyl acyltransferase